MKLPGLNSFKQAIVPVVISFLVLILLSFSVLTVSKGAFDVLIEDAAEEFELINIIEEINEETGADIPSLDKIFGLSDIIMVAHFVHPEFNASFQGELFGGEDRVKSSVTMWSGMFIYMLIPFISLFIGGVVSGYLNQNRRKSMLELNVAISLLYGIALSILSLVAGLSFSEKIREDAINLDMKLEIDYSFLAALGIGFLFAFIFAGLGMLFAKNFRKFTGNLSEVIPFGEAIHQAFSTMVRGIVLLFFFFVILLSSKIKLITDELGSEEAFQELIEKSYLFVASIGAQFSVYAWNLIHFGKFTFSGNTDGEDGSISYSVWSGLNGEGEGNSSLFFIEKGLETTDIPLYLKLAFIIPILLFIWAGYRMASRGNGIIEIAAFGFVYALLLSGVAAITDLGFIADFSGFDDGEMAFSAGFPFFGMFIRGFLFAFLFAYAGSWLRKLIQS